MREKVIAGNWKMYTTPEQGRTLVKDLLANIQDAELENKRVILFPPALHVESVADLTQNNANIHTGAQNCYFEKEGAFTGEISSSMIKAAGGEYVILGHSERRQYFGENNTMLAKKVNAVLAEGLKPVYCCGETLEEREQHRQFDIVEKQISEGLFHLTEPEIKNVIIAYEPVWAIGTGKTATPEQAQEIHKFIRKIVENKYGKSVSESIIILYGGSVKPDNASTLFSQPDIDGGLVGGASLKAADFAAIIKSA